VCCQVEHAAEHGWRVCILYPWLDIEERLLTTPAGCALYDQVARESALVSRSDSLTATFFPFSASTKTLLFSQHATKMTDDPRIQPFDNGLIEARALYDDDRLDEAVEKAEELLEDDDDALIFNKETYLLIAARSSSVSSHQMLPAYCGICGRLGGCRRSSEQVRCPLADGASICQPSRYACCLFLPSDSVLTIYNRAR
jgi:hypothetical protein